MTGVWILVLKPPDYGRISRQDRVGVHGSTAITGFGRLRREVGGCLCRIAERE